MTQEQGQRWQEYRQRCGHLQNWSEEMGEWTHQETQDPDIHSLTNAHYREKWFWSAKVKACEMTTWLNALEARLTALEGLADEAHDLVLNYLTHRGEWKEPFDRKGWLARYDAMKEAQGRTT